MIRRSILPPTDCAYVLKPRTANTFGIKARQGCSPSSTRLIDQRSPRGDQQRRTLARRGHDDAVKLGAKRIRLFNFTVQPAFRLASARCQLVMRWF
jgi:hypothetical protein